ncbi:hypothetical protein PU560_01905, partial [Georgenia sp. 10Sc9-8]|nr:hypothetical protein [Georgenia halotolerans]
MSNGLHVVDVLLLGDLRVGGPSPRWAAAALAAATDRGRTVALRQLSRTSAAVAPVDPAVRRHVDGAQVRLLVGDTPVRADLVVALDPAVLTECAGQLPDVDGRRVVVVADTPPPVDLETLVRDRFGAVPEWAGPDGSPADVLTAAVPGSSGDQAPGRAPGGRKLAEHVTSAEQPGTTDQPAPVARPAPSGAPHGTSQPPSATSPARERVLLVSSNGVGMGHLTRLLSYATRLPSKVEPHFLSMSGAVPIVGQLGLPYEYLPSAKEIGMRPDRWRRMFVRRFSETVARL